MDVTPLIPEGRQIIQGYSTGGFRVNGKSYEGAIIVTPLETSLWHAKDFASLNEQDFDALVENAGEIDVLLLGSGGTFQFFPPALRTALKARGLSVDSMDTGAACRTYNVLMAEGRRVVAALLPV